MNKHQVFILRGLPGSGKSTIAYQLTGGNESICEADDYFKDAQGGYHHDPKKLSEAHAECLKKFKRLLGRGITPVVVSNTSCASWEFREYTTIAKEFGYLVHSMIVENRHGSSDIHGVPIEHIERMADKFCIKLHPVLGENLTYP